MPLACHYRLFSGSPGAAKRSTGSFSREAAICAVSAAAILRSASLVACHGHLAAGRVNAAPAATCRVRRWLTAGQPFGQSIHPRRRSAAPDRQLDRTTKATVFALLAAAAVLTTPRREGGGEQTIKVGRKQIHGLSAHVQPP